MLNTTTMRSRNERRDGSTKFDSSVGLSSWIFTSTQMFYLIYQNRVNWLIMYINLENTEGVIKNGKSRETGNIGYTVRRKTKQKHSTIVLDTAI